MYIKIECECVEKKPHTQIECKLTRIHLSCSRTDVCTHTHTSNDLIDFPFMKPLSDSNEKKERRTEQTISIQFDSQAQIIGQQLLDCVCVCVPTAAIFHTQAIIPSTQEEVCVPWKT